MTGPEVGPNLLKSENNLLNSILQDPWNKKIPGDNASKN